MKILRSDRLYWLCQFAGWSSMVGIETINYTFFIAGKFNAALEKYLLISALLGCMITHLFRLLLSKTRFFASSLRYIWLMALLSTLIMAAVLMVINFSPDIFPDPASFFHRLRMIDVFGYLLNWSRYIGVWVIIYFMYKVLQQHNTLNREKIVAENLAKTTELELLKTQLNPHFLFNALNSIKALVTLDPDKSRMAIVQLSELLRFTLHYDKRQLITLSEEIDEVKKYLELEQLRFGERLEVHYAIHSNAVDYGVPPAMLLTLAENAIKHGVARETGGAYISIQAFCLDDCLFLKVINKGAYRFDGTSGIGLKNVTRRLEEIYLEKATFSIYDDAGYVVAAIKTPQKWL